MRNSEARTCCKPSPDLSEGMGVLALEEKTVSKFRGYWKCWGLIKRAVDVSSEGNESIVPAWRGMIWEQQRGTLALVQDEAGTW